MARPFNALLSYLDSRRRSADGDAALLARFSAWRDEAAFAELMRRHGPLVWGVCRQVLGRDDDADDAFQATFLLLARNASSVRDGSAVAGWLYGTARRVALYARRAAAVRRDREARVPVRPAGDVAADVAVRELQAFLHEEVARLPHDERAGFVLCVLEGRSRAEAARELGWNEGTLSTRLARARRRLRSRLARRGIELGAALCAAELARGPAPAELVRRTIAAAFSGTYSDAVAALMAGGVGTMLTTKTLMAAALVLGTALLAAATTELRGVGPALQPAPPAPAQTPVPAAGPRRPVVTRSFAVVPLTTALQRRLVGAADARSTAVVLIDGAELFTGPRTLDLKALDLNGLRKALAEYHPGKDNAIHFQMFFRSSESAQTDVRQLLLWGLEGLGREAGFGDASGQMMHFNSRYVWDDLVKPLREAGAGGPEADEPNQGTEGVEVYAVRTPLSRVLAGPADCVIDVRLPLDGRREMVLPAEAEKAVRSAVKGLKLPAGAKANFRFNVRNGDDDTSKRVHAMVLRLAKELGLELMSHAY